MKNGKKLVTHKVQQIKQTQPDGDMEVWAMDEHRLGLKPVIRRIWVDEFALPITNVN